MQQNAEIIQYIIKILHMTVTFKVLIIIFLILLFDCCFMLHRNTSLLWQQSAIEWGESDENPWLSAGFEQTQSS